MNLKDKMSRWARNCAAGIALAATLAAFVSPASAQWLTAPSQTDCGAYTFPPDSSIASIPNPVVAGNAYKLVFRGPARLDQYYFEPISEGVRLNLRATDLGTFFGRCYVFDAPLLAPQSAYVRLEIYGYSNSGDGGYSNVPGIERYLRALDSPPQPAPTLAGWGLLVLSLLLVFSARRRIKPLLSLFLFQMIAPPLWRIHIGG